MEVTGQASAAAQLAAIRARIDGGERGTALQALDALRAAHPHDDAIGLYWADLALRLKLGRHVPPIACAM
jgi:hypothetical protein